jgi:membrane-associated protein
MDAAIHQLIINVTHQGSFLLYLMLFAIIFVETGIVIFPFLPGDSILFLAGSVCAINTDDLNIFILFTLLCLAAILGDTLNFEIGKRFGNAIPKHPKLAKVLTAKRLNDSHAFFVKYGSIAIFIKRFMPIIRTIVPFVAGSSKMPYRKFVYFNIIGGVTWIALGLFSGYFFGSLPFVEKHFSLIMLAIVVISLAPALFIWIKERRGQAYS